MNPQTDSRILLAACGVVQKQGAKLAKHLGQLDQPDDIERIHQTRVACRRLRQALAFFNDCFNPEQLADWKKTTKKLLQRLGQARDLDVQAAFLQTFIDSLNAGSKKARPGLERLLLRIQQRRRQTQKEVLNAAAKFQRKKTLINIHLQTEKILCQLHREEPLTRNALQLRLQERLESAFNQMKEKESALNDPKDSGGHHALRIAVKHFRYTLEIANDITGGRLNTFVETAKYLQSLLGDLHDCAVWQDELGDFIDCEKERMKEYCGHTRSFGRLKPGIDILSIDRKHTAEELYRQTRDYVVNVHSRDTWQQVLEILALEPLKDTYEQED